MQTKKLALGTVLGALALFVWSMIAHMPPLGIAGYSTVQPAQEAAVLDMLRGAMRQRAIYMLPGMDLSRRPTAEEQQAWTMKYEAGPAAIVVYDPRPASRALTGSVFGTQLTVEFATALVSAFLAALISLNLSSALGYLPRALLLGVIGLIGTVDIDVSYWSWYAFPTPYLLAQLVDHAGGWLLAGLVLARVCKSSRD